jgi:hypothetical protein
MNRDKRLEPIERALTAREAVLVWLDEAHQFPSLDAYARSTADLASGEMPLSLMLARVEAGTRAGHAGEESSEQQKSVRIAVHDAVFLYMLVIELETAAERFAFDHTIRLRFATYILGDAELSLAEMEGRRDAELVSVWAGAERQSRELLAFLVEQAEVDLAARRMLVDRYLDGRSPLFPDTERACDLLERELDIARTCLRFGGPAGAPSADAPSIEDRAREQARDRLDAARVAAYDYLGDRSAALEITRARLLRPRLPLR